MDGAAALRRTKFTRTCSLLQQYIREKGGGSAAGLLGTTATPTPDTPNKSPAEPAGHPASLPDLNGQATGITGQMTIFYDGMVLVFDDFPAHKAKQLMDAVTNKEGIQPFPMMTSKKGKTIIHHATSEGGDPAATSHDQLNLPGSDLPIARRVSLNRFLEKRKDRIITKAPYPLVGSRFGPEDHAPAPATLEPSEKTPPPVLENEEDDGAFPSWLGLAPAGGRETMPSQPGL